MWQNRTGRTPEEKFKDVEEELSLENLKNQWLSDFPSADEMKEGDIILVDDSTNTYLVTKRNGTRYRAAFTAF